MGCIPSKALLNASHKYVEVQHLESYGVRVAGVTFDLPTMLKQKDDAVTALTGGIEYLFKKNNVRYVKGKASFTGPDSLAVQLAAGGSETIRAKHIVIATGSDVMDLPGIQVRDNGRVGCFCPFPLNSRSAMRSTFCPRRARCPFPRCPRTCW